MSRWSKRSEEEKQAILQKQQEQEAKAEQAKLDKDPVLAELARARDMDAANAVYKSGEIPILCRDDGWVGSELYALYKGEPLPGVKLDMLKGRCRKCGRPVQRVFPTGEEFLLFALAISNLKMKGRLQDTRGVVDGR